MKRVVGVLVIVLLAAPGCCRRPCDPCVGRSLGPCVPPPARIKFFNTSGRKVRVKRIPNAAARDGGVQFELQDGGETNTVGDDEQILAGGTYLVDPSQTPPATGTLQSIALPTWGGHPNYRTVSYEIHVLIEHDPGATPTTWDEGTITFSVPDPASHDIKDPQVMEVHLTRSDATHTKVRVLAWYLDGSTWFDASAERVVQH